MFRRQLLELPNVELKNAFAARFVCTGVVKQILDTASRPAVLRAQAQMDR
jgi:hypothetical protein